MEKPELMKVVKAFTEICQKDYSKINYFSIDRSRTSIELYISFVDVEKCL